jgi:LuxR family maltose regulon positive regulatory protein
LNYGHYHLGRVCYLQNDLIAAEQHFATVVQQPYLNYGDCIVHSACGLALTYQLQGKSDEAQAVIDTITTFLLETGNASMMPLIQALQAEIALRQGQIAAAGQWAANVDPIPPLSPMVEFFVPHLALVKIWLAQDTPASRQKAADLLDTARAYVESTHNTRFLIEVLALQTIQNIEQDERQTALELLEQAIDLAQPGGFIRPFVDLGSQMADLLAELKPQNGEMQQYVGQILAAFDKADGGKLKTEDKKIHPSSFRLQPLIEPLTNREQDVLECLQLTDKEISQRLVISSHTVRTHIKGIFGKLNVANRRQAIARARELGLLKE